MRLVSPSRRASRSVLCTSRSKMPSARVPCQSTSYEAFDGSLLIRVHLCSSVANSLHVGCPHKPIFTRRIHPPATPVNHATYPPKSHCRAPPPVRLKKLHPPKSHFSQNIFLPLTPQYL